MAGKEKYLHTNKGIVIIVVAIVVIVTVINVLSQAGFPLTTKLTFLRPKQVYKTSQFSILQPLAMGYVQNAIVNIRFIKIKS